MSFDKSRGKKRNIFASALLIIRILFVGMQSSPASSNSTNFQDGVNSKTEISRVLEKESFGHEKRCAQPEQLIKGSQTSFEIPRGGDDSIQPGKFTAGSKAKGAARSDLARPQPGKKPTSGRSGGSPFAEAFTTEPNFPARPGVNNGDGLFGRFTPRPTPDPLNPGCAAGPRSTTVLSGQRNSDESTKLTAYDGFEAKLTDKSENHLTSKHGHKFGVDDPLPRNPNQKPTKYEQTRTRLNNENKVKVREEIQSILSNTNSDIYLDVSIRGIEGQVYHCKDTNRVVGIHTEGEFAGQIMKAQPISGRQLEFLRELNILD